MLIIAFIASFKTDLNALKLQCKCLSSSRFQNIITVMSLPQVEVKVETAEELCKCL